MGVSRATERTAARPPLLERTYEPCRLSEPSLYFVHSRRWGLAAALLVIVLSALLLVPAGAFGWAWDVPVGMANTNDQNLRNSHWLYAIRFVLDRDTTMYRFFSQMKAKGANWDEHGGTRCTVAGRGLLRGGRWWRINARLVRIKADGTPDLGSVLAQETIDPRTRYFETKAAYGVSAISLFWYYNMGGASLKANTPYAMVYRNVHADPVHNFSSTNSLTVKESEAGPNGRNNLDPTRRERSRGSIRVKRRPGRPTAARLGPGAARSVTTTAARARTTARACRTMAGSHRRQQAGVKSAL